MGGGKGAGERGGARGTNIRFKVYCPIKYVRSVNSDLPETRRASCRFRNLIRHFTLMIGGADDRALFPRSFISFGDNYDCR